jgi:hypothetical protein
MISDSNQDGLPFLESTMFVKHYGLSHGSEQVSVLRLDSK